MSDATPMIDSVTLGDLAELLQEAGYRTNESEQNGLRQLLSASQGVGFAVRPGNPHVEDGERLLDVTLSCALRIDGVLPEGMVTTWNRSKRFGRLSQQGDFLVLEMDVLVAGGVSRGHLLTSVELWDRLMRELLLYLRNYRAPAQEAEAGEPAAS